MTTTAAAVPALDFRVRDATEDDRKFIVECTAKVRLPHGVNWTDWKRGGLEAATADFVNGYSRVAEADGVLVGFALWSSAGLSMLYVKKDFRGCGVGRALIAGAPVPMYITKPTPSWRQWCRRHGITWVEVG